MKLQCIIGAWLLTGCIALNGQDQKKSSDELLSGMKANISRTVLKKFNKGDDHVIAWIQEDPANKNAVQNIQTENKTLLMLAIELGRKKVIDYLLDNNVDTTPQAKGTTRGDALDFLIYVSGPNKENDENISVAIKLVDLMIAQGMRTETLLKRLAFLSAGLYAEEKQLKSDIDKSSFWHSGRYKNILKDTQKSLRIINAIIEHLAKKEATRRNDSKK